MRPAFIRSVLAALAFLVLTVTSASAGGGKTHVAVPVGQILSLVSEVAPNDNSGGHGFNFDNSGPPFVVPKGFSFVATDMQIHPASGVAATDHFVVFVNFDTSGSRFFDADYFGSIFYHTFQTGFVVPSETTPTVRTSTGTAGVVVQLQGYLVKGSGLPSNTAF
jgi:hypothetical protein